MFGSAIWHSTLPAHHPLFCLDGCACCSCLAGPRWPRVGLEVPGTGFRLGRVVLFPWRSVLPGFVPRPPQRSCRRLPLPVTKGGPAAWRGQVWGSSPLCGWHSVLKTQLSLYFVGFWGPFWRVGLLAERRSWELQSHEEAPVHTQIRTLHVHVSRRGEPCFLPTEVLHLPWSTDT